MGLLAARRDPQARSHLKPHDSRPERAREWPCPFRGYGYARNRDHAPATTTGAFRRRRTNPGVVICYAEKIEFRHAMWARQVGGGSHPNAARERRQSERQSDDN